MIEEKERPDFLKVLCILTFISSGFSILGSILMTFMGSPEMIDAITTAIEDMGQDASAISRVLEHAIGMGIANALLSMISLAGAILMYNLNRTGFFLYALAQIAMLFVSPIFMGMSEFSIWGMLFNGLWIAMYFSNLKYMTKGCACCCSSTNNSSCCSTDKE